ncbi:partial dTMP kinase, partial [uncultured bacterium]
GVDPWAELFSYEACRAQVVSKVIKPALGTGKMVLCDRFFDSTLAYQGYGRGLDRAKIKGLNALATGGLVPDLTVLVDCPVEVGLKRAWARINASGGAREDRFEKEALAFHERVRRGFLAIARRAGRVRVVDGSREISTVHREICDIIEGVPGLLPGAC